MRVGSIFKWGDYEKQPDLRVSGRLFIYFGRSPSFLNPVYAYIASTTARTSYYKPGGQYRNNKNTVWFNQGECKFKEECILDFDRYFYYDIELNDIIDKTVIDIIPNEKLRMIYNKIYNCKRISDEIVNDIHFCFNGIGIKNLKKR